MKTPRKRKLTAKALAWQPENRARVEKPRKGRGSYTRKGRNNRTGPAGPVSTSMGGAGAPGPTTQIARAVAR